MGHLISTYVFGSVGRGDHDRLSDLDLLAIVRDGEGLVPEASVLSAIPLALKGLTPSISWYGIARLREMFANGELFAWHLYQDSTSIFGDDTVLEKMGPPSPYRGCLADVASFRKILDGIPAQLRGNSNNAHFEAGLIYVCLRNISMSASWALCDRPDFSRGSAYCLGETLTCPLPKAQFAQFQSCRMASQRGAPLPKEIDAALVLQSYEIIRPWLDSLNDAITEKLLNGPT